MNREMSVFADGRSIAAGCRLHLSGKETLSVRPDLFRLEIYDLSGSSFSLLAGAKKISVRSGPSVLAEGSICGVHRRQEAGRSLVTAVFSPAYDFWQSSVSLSVPAGMRLSDTARLLLEGSGFPLLSFSGQDRVFSRAQAFYGRRADALARLAEAAGAEACVTAEGVRVIGKTDQAVTLELTERELLSAPSPADGRVILTVPVSGWPVGAYVRFTHPGGTGEGRIVSRLLDADTASGPWRSELLAEV